MINDELIFSLCVLIVSMLFFIMFVVNCIFFNKMINSPSSNVSSNTATMLVWFNAIMAIVSFGIFLWAIVKVIIEERHTTKNILSIATEPMQLEMRGSETKSKTVEQPSVKSMRQEMVEPVKNYAKPMQFEMSEPVKNSAKPMQFEMSEPVQISAKPSSYISPDAPAPAGDLYAVF